METKHGSWFSHDDTPRAQLFKAGQGNVQDAESMIDLLRSNKFTRSAIAQPEGCNGRIPQAAIAARGDHHISFFSIFFFDESQFLFIWC